VGDIGELIGGALVIAAIIAIAIVIGGFMERSQKSRKESALTPLAPLVGGTVSDGRLKGTHEGYTVEAWSERHDPYGSSDASRATEVDVFYLTLAGVPGRQYWFFRPRPQLFAAPEFHFEGVFDRPSRLDAMFATVTGYSAPDAALEERLRAAGIIEEISHLGSRDSGYFPVVGFVPPVPRKSLEQMPASVLAQAASQDPATLSGGLRLEIEMDTGKVPTPEGLRALLDGAMRVARINAEANPPEGA
jgi:hypothetical protein